MYVLVIKYMLSNIFFIDHHCKIQSELSSRKSQNLLNFLQTDYVLLKIHSIWSVQQSYNILVLTTCTIKGLNISQEFFI